MRLIIGWALCVATVHAAAAAAAAQRYGAVESGALVPRYFLDQSLPLAKRADSCPDDHHSCRDTGFDDECCANTHYCYINADGVSRCCPIGSSCSHLDPPNPCTQSDEFLCTTTVSESGSATASTTCCQRRCTATSQYRCASSLGDGCCGYASECRSGGFCVSTVQPTSTSTTDSLTPIAEGCTTSQYQCEDGLGCCDNDHTCTEVTGEGYCAPGRPTETDGETTDADGDDLSDGAKVGIGVGSVVGAGLIFGALTWLCIRKRRERRRTLTAPSGGGGGSQGHQHDAQDPAAMTEITASSRPRQHTGLTQDYFGPHPVAGPFTETTARSPGSMSGPDRAVPHRPDQPGDIAAAVEMDSNDGGRLSPGSQPSYFTSPVPINAIEGTYEMEDSGTTNHPSPRSPSISPTPVGYSRRIDNSFQP